MASNVLKLLDAQNAQLRNLESSVNLISQTVDMHREKVSRREIGVFTTVKRMPRNQKIIPPPATPEQKTKYSRTPIAYATLDSVGHGMKSNRGRITDRARLGLGGLELLRVTAFRTVVSPARARSDCKAPCGSPTRQIINSTRSTKAPEPVQCPVAPSLTRGPSLSSLNERPSGALHNRALRPLSDVFAVAEENGFPPPLMSNAPPPPPVTDAFDLPAPPPLPGNGLSSATFPRALYSESAVLESSSTRTAVRHAGNARAGLCQHASKPRQQSVLLPLLSSPSLSVIIPPPPPYPPPLAPLALLTPPPGLAKRFLHLVRTCNSNPSLLLIEMDFQPPPPPLDMFGAYEDSVPPLPPPVDYDLDAPPSYEEKAVALYSYSSGKEDELTFQEGDIIYIIQKHADGWYRGFFNGVEGYFPGNYVGPAS
ncbi:ABI1 protein, partial [Atractosteus spatula]|nr:ABI1 protein [Atractosteus spatula]